jgi:hypothetical protein
MMKGRQLRAMSRRIDAVEKLLDKLDRSMERVELVTVVREPNTGISADAYNGLRKQVIAAVGERTAHLNQLAQFDSSLRAGASAEELAALVREWLGQTSVELIEDPAVEGAFELVGPEDAPGRRVIRPAYVDRVTGRVVRGGIVERVEEEPDLAVKTTDEETINAMGGTQ